MPFDYSNGIITDMAKVCILPHKDICYISYFIRANVLRKFSN